MNGHRPDKHGACRQSTYFATHDANLQRFVGAGFVGYDTLQIVWLSADVLLLQGCIACQGRLVIAVDKLLSRIPGGPEHDPLIQTEKYSYNVFVQGFGNVFRYDNRHGNPRYDRHTDDHHKHLFDWQTGDELPESPLWIGVESWPTLGEVTEEARQWYWKHQHRLPSTDFPSPDYLR